MLCFKDVELIHKLLDNKSLYDRISLLFDILKKETSMSDLKSSNVHKRTIVENVARKTGNLTQDTSKIIETFLSEIVNELAKGNRLEFRGFGVFEIVNRKKKLARNPRTNEEVMVPARKAIKFKMGKNMREICNP